jgi:hypothetical protein
MFAGSAAARAGIALGRNWQQDYSAPESSFSLYRSWLSECIAGHRSCVYSPTTQLPSRVLEVSSLDGTATLRLIQSMGLSGQYIALSHCWGTHSGLKTSKPSLREYMDAINPSSLSKTVDDAVSITRGLGIRYLWVDTLCIIQDDPEDWERESSKMNQIYRSSLVMIAASGSKDGRGGCFLPKPAGPHPVIVPVVITPPKENVSVTFKIHCGSATMGLHDLPLNQRGWCLQESLLPQRILHFRKDRVIWQCRECFTGEDYVYLRRNRHEPVSIDSIERFPQLSDKPDLHNWLNIVEDYSRRELTVYTDKLYAMDGLANYFKSFLNTTYMYGIWSDSMHLGLLWISADGKMRDPPGWRAPSWSWAALDGPVYHLPTLQSFSLRQNPCVQILKFEKVEQSGTAAASRSTKFGEGVLNVCAPLCKIYRSDSLIVASDEFNTIASKPLNDLLYKRRTMQCHSLFTSAGNACGWAAFDQESFVQEDLHCLLMDTVRDEIEFFAHNVMMLGYADNGEGTGFRRLGVGEIIQEDFFDNISGESVILV